MGDRKRGRDREKAPICWFTPPVTATAEVGLGPEPGDGEAIQISHVANILKCSLGVKY